MRKTLFIFCSVLSFFLFAVSTSAAYTLPNYIYTVEDGDTVIGPLKIPDTPGNYGVPSDFMAEWAASPRNVCSFILNPNGSGNIYFYIVPDDIDFTFRRDTSMPHLMIRPDKLCQIPVALAGFDKYGLRYNMELTKYYVGGSNNISMGDILTSTYIDNNPDAMQNLTGWVEYIGKLRFADNLNILNPPEPDPPPPEPEPEPEPEPLPPAPPIDTSLIALQQPYVDAGYRLINTNIGKIINAAVIVMLWVSFMVLAIRLIAEIGGSA